MPFVNPKQQRVCVAKSMDAVSKGEKPKWNCESYKCHATEDQSSACKSVRKGGAIGSKIHEGARGGLYFTIKDEDKERKFYIPKENQSAMVAKFGIEKKPVKFSPYKKTSPTKGKAKRRSNKK